ncbi:hypothetical protein CsSME_00005581 [Camellia sinensis var. sinensis]
MEKLLNPYDKEYMKMAMLKHEKTFKQQVYELHRLYRIQKILMTNVEHGRPNGENQERWNFMRGISLTHMNDHQIHHHIHHKSRPGLDLEQPVKDEYIAETNGEIAHEIEDESEIQLTLGPTSYYRRKKKGETPRTSDSGPSFSSSSTGSSHMKRTNSGTNHTTRDDHLTGQKLGLTMVPDSNSGLQSGRRNSFDVEEQLNQDRLTLPPWLFQPRSMKFRT